MENSKENIFIYLELLGNLKCYKDEDFLTMVMHSYLYFNEVPTTMNRMAANIKINCA
jgi:hypothetical protein